MPYPPSGPPSAPGQGGAPNPWAPRGPGGTSAPGGPWAPPAGRPPAGAWAPPSAPGRPAQPWAPTGWQAPGGQPTGPPQASGGGYPPVPPGYAARPAGAHAPAPEQAPPGRDGGGRLASALVGGIVGAVVAALVAAGLVLATDDDPGANRASATTTAPTRLAPGESLDIQQILTAAQPSVVSINTRVGGQTVGAGTGFVIDAEQGLILTNAHVVEGADEVAVTFFDGSALGAELVGSFPDDDVAMVRVEGREDLRAAVLGSSEQLLVGEDVVAIGNALGLGGKPTVTTGIVSAKGRTLPTETGTTLENLIQTDAAINPGNSGGPLLNARGEVVGINTAIIQGASNVGFALSIDSIRPLIEDLRAGNGEINPDQAFLGVTGVAVTSPDLPPETLTEFGITSSFGVIVAVVAPDSAAEEAGLQIGDVITEIGGQTAEDTDVIAEVVRSKAPGDAVEITYERRGQSETVTVTLTRRGG